MEYQLHIDDDLSGKCGGGFMYYMSRDGSQYPPSLDLLLTMYGLPKTAFVSL